MSGREATLSGLEKWCDRDFLPEGCTAVHISVNNNNPSALCYLIDLHCPQEVEGLLEAPDNHGRTPLGIALELGRFESATVLIRNGARLDVPISYSSGHLQLCNLLEKPPYHSLVYALMKEGIKLAINRSLVRTALLSAVQTRDEQLLSAVLEDYEIDANGKDWLGSSALHYGSHNGHASFARQLLEHNASPLLQDSRGKTPLHIASARGHLDVVCEILTASSESSFELDEVLNVQDDSGRTCAHCALYCKQFEVVVHLLNNFAAHLDFNLRDASGHTLPGLLFYFRFHMNVLPKSVQLSFPCLSAEEVSWSLHVAASEGDLDLLQHTLEASQLSLASLDCFDFANMTPLMWASRRGHVGVCQSLVEGGADINLADNHGVTALHHACYGNQLRVVEYVLSINHLNVGVVFDTLLWNSFSAELLELLAEFFASGYNLQKPSEWRRWLVMAAGNISMTKSLFSALVKAVCPYDWLKQLSNDDVKEQSPPAATDGLPSNHCYLPSYEVHWSKEEPYINMTKQKLSEDFIKMKSKVSRRKSDSRKIKQSFTGLGASKRKFQVSRDEGRGNYYEVMKFKKMRMRRKIKSSVISGGDTRNATISYPLHEAVRHGNAEVVDYILDQAENESRAVHKLLLFQVEETSGLSLVELMAARREKFVHHLTPSVVEEMGRRLGYGLPGHMTYAQALMHYLITSSKPATFKYVDSKYKRSLTPLDLWSPAYRNTVFHQYIVAANLAADDVCDDPYQMSSEHKQQLLSALLDREGLPDASVYNDQNYTSLLYAATNLKCVWAVELLVELGTPGILNDAILGNFWAPICDIGKTSDVDLIELLVSEASRDSLKDGQVQELSYGLLFLVSRDLLPWAESLYDKVVSKYGSIFWTSDRGPRLIYLSYLHNGAGFGQRLVVDMLRTVCTCFFSSHPIKKVFKYQKAMKAFSCVGCVLASKIFKTESVAQDLVVSRQIFLTIERHLPFCFFHHMCIKGDYNTLKLVLDILKEEVHENFFINSDTIGYRPLLLSIINGHFDIVKLLLDNGCPLTIPGDGLVELTAAVLHIKLTKDKCMQWKSFLPKYLHYLWPGHTDYVSETLGKHELGNGVYCSDMVEYLISICDFKSIAVSSNLDILLHEIASLSSLDHAERILSELGIHMEQVQDVLDSGDGSVHGPNHITTNPVLYELGISKKDMKLMEASEDSNDKSPSYKPHKLLCIAWKLPPLWQTSAELLGVMDVALCSLGSFDDIDGSVVVVASEKGLWLLVKKLLPLVMHLDKVVLNVLRCSLSQSQHDYFDSLYFEMKNTNRTFTEGFNDVLCTAINVRNSQAVETFLEVAGDISTLVHPFCLAVSKHLHQAAFHILTKMLSGGSLQLDHIYKILKVAARHNNSYVVEHFLSNSYYLSEVAETSEEEESVLLFTTLAEAASHSHQDLALTLASSLVAKFDFASANDRVIAEYMKALSWCSYWGLTKVLSHLPYANEVLLKLPSSESEALEGRHEVVVPLLYAEARGNIGKLANIDSLHLPTVDLKVIKRRNANSLLTGTYSTFNNMKKERHTTTAYNLDFGHLQDIFSREAYYGGKDYIQAFFIDHLGASNTPYFQFVCKMYKCDEIFSCLVEASCRSREGPSNLNVLLGYITTIGIDYLAESSMLQQSFIRCIGKGMVDFVKVFVQHVPNLLNSFSMAHLLNTAVSSNTPEMVDFVLSKLGDLGPDCCFQEDDADLAYESGTKFPYPLYAAFAWGRYQVICDSSLLSTASQVANFEFTKWEKASCCQGWFHSMMERNAKLVSPSGHLNAESLETYTLPKYFSIAAMSRCSFKISLLRNSTCWGVDSVTTAVLKSCGGVFVQLNQLSRKEMKRLSHVLMNKTVFNFLKAQPYCEEALQKFVEKTKDFNLVKVAIQELAKWQGSKEELIELLTLFRSLSTDSGLYEKIFLTSCELGLSKVAIPLVNSDILGEELHSILEKGLQEALLYRRYDIVAEIMAKLNIKEVNVEKVGGNELFQLIFSIKDYYSILNKFFESLISGERMSLAVMWLTHTWSKREAEFVVNRLGSMYAPPNPWVLSRGEQGNMSITVDWNSFSESLLTSPQVTEQHESHFHFVPIMVEAIVFSPAVLGQIIPSFCNCGKSFEHPESIALLSEVQSFSSIIISCSILGEPSLASLGGGQGLLTIVYEPGNKKFTFPELSKVVPEPPVVKTPCITCKEDVTSLVSHLRNKAKSTLGLSMSVCFSEFLSNEIETLPRYGSKGVVYYDLLATVLKDLFDALELVLVPKVPCPLLSIKKKIVCGIKLQLDCRSIEDEKSTYTIKVADSFLVIIMHLPFAEDFSLESSELCTCSFYNELVEDIRLSILTEHVRIFESKASSLGAAIANIFSSSFNACFHTSVNTDYIKLFSNEPNTVVDKIELALHFVSYIKQLNLLCKFLRTFHKMLGNYRDNISCHLGKSNDFLFDVECHRHAGSSFFEKKDGNIRMEIPMATLLVKQKFYDSLVHAWQSFILMTTGKRRTPKLTDKIKPSVAPIACYVDYHQSPGLYFPVLDTKKEITIQLVDHDGCDLNYLPSATDITVSINICHVESKDTVQYSCLFSAERKISGRNFNEDGNKEPRRIHWVHSRMTNLARVTWEPHMTGLYVVRIFINQVPIRDSPHKCVCIDKEVLQTQKKFVALTEHADCPSCPAPVKKFQRKPIRRRYLWTRSHKEFKRTLEKLPTHQFSLYMDYGYFQWSLYRDDAITVHAVAKDLCGYVHFSAKVHNLSGGLYHVTVQPRYSCSIFVSCSSCMSALKMFFVDGSTSVYPVDFIL